VFFVFGTKKMKVKVKLLNRKGRPINKKEGEKIKQALSACLAQKELASTGEKEKNAKKSK
jgi:dUTPase